jgi:hypothetical protein
VLFQAFVSHILENNPQHITINLLKEYFTVLPFMATDCAAFHHYSCRLPWADSLCMPFTLLIQAPAMADAQEFERRMANRCGGDFNRNLALVTPPPERRSKKGIECLCV